MTKVFVEQPLALPGSANYVLIFKLISLGLKLASKSPENFSSSKGLLTNVCGNIKVSRKAKHFGKATFLANGRNKAMAAGQKLWEDLEEDMHMYGAL